MLDYDGVDGACFGVLAMLDFIGTLRGRSAGEALDAVGRKVKLRRWRRRATIAVQVKDRRAMLNTRMGSTDAEVVYQCFVARQYEVPKVDGVAPHHHDAVEAAYKGILREGKTPLIVDCGANIGAGAAWFDMRYPRSKIVAVEPAAANVALLRRNCADRPNIVIVEAGVGPSDSTAYVLDQGGGHWGYQTTEKPTGTAIDIVSLAGLIASHSDATPFILKIDIEGAERTLFEQSLDLIGSFPIIILEPHDFCMPGQRTASPFFKFHGAAGRDFAFRFENVFSMDMDALQRLGAEISSPASAKPHPPSAQQHGSA